MLVEFNQGFVMVLPAPYQEFVIISSWGELLIIGTPFKSTNFLLVALKFCKEVILSSEISM